MHLIHMRQRRHQPILTTQANKITLEYYGKVTGMYTNANIPTLHSFRQRIEQRVSDILTMCDVYEDTNTLQLDNLGCKLGVMQQLCNMGTYNIILHVLMFLVTFPQNNIIFVNTVLHNHNHIIIITFYNYNTNCSIA